MTVANTERTPEPTAPERTTVTRLRSGAGTSSHVVFVHRASLGNVYKVARPAGERDGVLRVVQGERSSPLGVDPANVVGSAPHALAADAVARVGNARRATLEDAFVQRLRTRIAKGDSAYYTLVAELPAMRSALPSVVYAGVHAALPVLAGVAALSDALAGEHAAFAEEVDRLETDVRRHVSLSRALNRVREGYDGSTGAREDAGAGVVVPFTLH